MKHIKLFENFDEEKFYKGFILPEIDDNDEEGFWDGEDENLLVKMLSPLTIDQAEKISMYAKIAPGLNYWENQQLIKWMEFHKKEIASKYGKFIVNLKRSFSNKDFEDEVEVFHALDNVLTGSASPKKITESAPRSSNPADLFSNYDEFITSNDRIFTYDKEEADGFAGTLPWKLLNANIKDKLVTWSNEDVDLNKFQGIKTLIDIFVGEEGEFNTLGELSKYKINGLPVIKKVKNPLSEDYYIDEWFHVKKTASGIPVLFMEYYPDAIVTIKHADKEAFKNDILNWIAKNPKGIKAYLDYFNSTLS